MTRDDVFSIINEKPGVTAVDILMTMAERHWSRRWFGDGVLNMLLAPSLGSIYPMLIRLRRDKLISRLEGELSMNGSRRVRYYPAMGRE